MINIKSFIIEYLKIFGIGTLVYLLWIGLEKALMGEITPNIADSIIAIILTFSTYGNVVWWESKDKK